MNKNKKTPKFLETIKLRDLVSIFLRRKWIFISFFLAVLIIGLLFTFIKTPVYQSYSVLKLKDIYYDENLYKYFPEEAQKLGIFAPGMDVEELERSVLTDITKDIRSDILLDDIIPRLDFKINKEELNEIISTLVDQGNRVVRIIVTGDNAEGVYQINNTLVNIYLENNKNEKSEIIEDIISEVNDRTDSLQEQYEGIKTQNGETNDINSELDSINSLMVDLNKIRYNLENNKEVYVNNIELYEESSFPIEAINMDNFKSILIAIFAAAAVGLIAVYIPNVFIPFRE